MMTELSVWLLVAGGLTSVIGPAASAYAGDVVGREQAWYVVMFSGMPVGLATDLQTHDDNGWFYENHLDIQASRLGTPIVMAIHATGWEDADGRLIRFRTEVTMGDSDMHTSGERKGDSLLIRSESQGFIQRKSVVWEPGAVGQGALDSFVRGQLRTGEREFSARVFDVQTLRFRSSRFVVTDTLVEINNGEVSRLLVVEQFDDDSQSATMTLKIDEHQDIREMIMRQLGLEIVIKRIEEDEVSSLSLDPNFDIIRGSMIRCDGFPEPVDEIAEVVFELTFAKPVDEQSGFYGPNQSVLSGEANVLEVLVSREPIVDHMVADEPLDKYLQSDRYIQSAHPAIADVADSIAAAVGKTGLPLAQAIAGWVNLHITNKSLATGFTSAADVLTSREGDCTEHSVLLAAVLRAAGIPTRVVVGLAHGDGHLIGHMWTEVYVSGWRTLDALDLNTHPIRIRIAASPDERAFDETDVIQAYSLLGDLKVRVKSHQKMR
ncbi:MAG: lasso peptide biosynthesis protein [Candidatus Krumholzibacteria bacterium]|nr:lasso peptide biosynthesis protein [Candidatus Krumholzibacteria bacterium]